MFLRFLLFSLCLSGAVPLFASPTPQAADDSANLPPAPGVYGASGTWKSLTADTAPARTASLAIWSDRMNVNPGQLTVTTSGVSIAGGITSFAEAGLSFEAYQSVHVGRPDQLSFGQQALGFFGNQTPGAPPTPSELIAGSSRVPQLRSPASPSGALTGAAGYYDLFPFAGLVTDGGAVGSIALESKMKLLSEGAGAPAGVAVHAYFDIPVHKAIDFLMTHPVGTADLQVGVDGIVSRSIGKSLTLYGNAGYRHIDQPAHASVFHLADDVTLRFGWTVPIRKRIQFAGETAADVFVGEHTPNTSFGPGDPVSMTVGFKTPLGRSAAFSGGYRRPLNQFGGDKNGFVFVLSQSYGVAR